MSEDLSKLCPTKRHAVPPGPQLQRQLTYGSSLFTSFPDSIPDTENSAHEESEVRFES